MSLGPGKYDALCTHVRETAHADGAVVIVLNGQQGNGFSVQGPITVTLSLPAILRVLADDIEQSLRQGKL